jgi:hypothetical protein
MPLFNRRAEPMRNATHPAVYALTRRTAILSVPLAALAACAGTTSTTVANYAQVAENAAIDVLGYLPSSPTTTALIGYLNDAKTAAAAIIANAPATGASWQQQLYNAIVAALPVAAPLLSSIPGASLGIEALQAVAPLVAAALGLAGAPLVAASGIPVITFAQAQRVYGK